MSPTLEAEIDAHHAQEIATAKGAACIIESQEKVVLIRHRLTGKLDFPGGGFSGDNSTACTAHRETWEETGFNVSVETYLAKTNNGLLLFGCDLDAGIDTLPDVFEPPPWATIEVSAIEKVDPFLIDHQDLRFEDDLILLRDSFISFDAKK